MRLHSRLGIVGAISVLALAISPAAAFAHDGGGHGHGGDVLRADVVPINGPTDPMIFDSPAAGAPWVIDRGEVRVRDDGRTDVRLEGFQVLRPDGTTDNPAANVTVGVYCNGMLADRSDLQPMTVPDGDARFRVDLDVPKHCDMATALIQLPPAAGSTVFRYIGSAMGDDD